MVNGKLLLGIEILASLSFIASALLLGNITAAVIGTNPALDEKYGFLILALGLALTALFVILKRMKTED